jgi:GTP-binding protein EngB required for normal cell division
MPPSVPTPDPLSTLVDELLMLLSESAEFHREAEVKAVFREAIGIAIVVRRRLELSRERFVVGIVGQTNVGKSTLMEALLGKEIVPRRNGPCTAAPVEFSWASEFRIQAEYIPSFQRRSWNGMDASEIRQLLGQLVDESQNETIGQADWPSRVRVQLPLPLLETGLVIADTPGFGAAQVDIQRAGTHDEVLQTYLQNEVSQVFWVVLGEQGILKRERDFYEQFLSQICDDLVVTGCDDWSQQDQQRFRSRFSSQLGFRVPRFHFVSGLQGTLARSNQDAQQLEAAGIAQLENRIRSLADPQCRQQVLKDSLLQLAENLGEWLFNFRDVRRRTLDLWWRPDSWLRWLDLRDQTLTAALNQSLTQRFP